MRVAFSLTALLAASTAFAGPSGAFTESFDNLWMPKYVQPETFIVNGDLVDESEFPEVLMVTCGPSASAPAWA